MKPPFLQVKSGESLILSYFVPRNHHPKVDEILVVGEVPMASHGPIRGFWSAGPAISEIEEIVKDTALSLIGVESLENDEPLMDAGAPDESPAR